VLRHGHYLVPHFHAATHRVAFSRQLEHPQTLPRFYWAPTWMLKTWWLADGSANR
jgi:microcin C transport system substrate-binding protein